MHENEVFISYARKDSARVEPFVAALKNEGVSLWIDQRNMVGGNTWSSQIAMAIRACQILILVVSKASMDSTVVADEVLFARHLNKKILPLYLEDLQENQIHPALQLFLLHLQHIRLFTQATDEALAETVHTLLALGIRPINHTQPPVQPLTQTEQAYDLEQMGDLEGARENLQQVLNETPQQQDIQNHLAEIESKIQDQALYEANFERFRHSDTAQQLIQTAVRDDRIATADEIEQALRAADLWPVAIDQVLFYLTAAFERNAQTQIRHIAQQAEASILEHLFDDADELIQKIIDLNPKAPEKNALIHLYQQERRRAIDAAPLLARCKALLAKRNYRALLQLQAKYPQQAATGELKSIFATATRHMNLSKDLQRGIDKAHRLQDKHQILEAYFHLLQMQLDATEQDARTYIDEYLDPIESLVRTREADLRAHLPEHMVLIPSGYYLHRTEQTAHPIFLPCYAIDQHQVTNERYAAFLSDHEATDKDHTPDGWNALSVDASDKPVNGVDWYDATAYAVWAGYQLPTDRQWEKAAYWHPDEGRLLTFPWGMGFDPQHCNTAESGLQSTRPVGQSQSGASYYGVHDMFGNLWEWCCDEFHPLHLSNEADPNDLSEISGNDARILRGGSWAEHADHLADQCRSRAYPHTRSPATGFRCAQTLKLDFS